nr:Glu/Leu/Phe/Val dehydrogenase [Actinomycetota bacterium]
MRITNLKVDGYERVAQAEDEASGLRAFISVHSTRLGPSLGGMRLWPYATEDAALEDVLRLSRAMTYKSAVAGTGLGGGKSVIIADPRDKSDALFEAMGRFVEDFAGAYITAEDVNVGIPDLRAVRRITSHVTGLSVEEGGGGNPRAATALGCFLGVGAAMLRAAGSADLAGKTVAVQGLGSVGYGLAEHLARAGARLVAADVNRERVERAIAELGAEVVAPEDVYDVECDVLAPCALGGVLNDD